MHSQHQYEESSPGILQRVFRGSCNGAPTITAAIAEHVFASIYRECVMSSSSHPRLLAHRVGNFVYRRLQSDGFSHNARRLGPRPERIRRSCLRDYLPSQGGVYQEGASRCISLRNGLREKGPVDRKAVLLTLLRETSSENDKPIFTSCRRKEMHALSWTGLCHATPASSFSSACSNEARTQRNRCLSFR